MRGPSTTFARNYSMSTFSMDTRRLKLLLIAPSCGSDGIGEAWSSFQWVSGLAKRHDVTLLTTGDDPSTSRNADFRDLQVVECPKLRLFEKWERFNAMAKPGYVKFYFHARRWLISRLQSGESFDLVHQISPLGPSISKSRGRSPSPARHRTVGRKPRQPPRVQ